jgi:hypothetical protein
MEHRLARAIAGDLPEVRAWGNAACRADRELDTVQLP